MPDISVIIPTRNRPRRLALCLGALAAQAYPFDRFEVIVVADGSDIPMAPILAPFDGRLRLRLVEQERTGPAGARNTGATHATAALLAFTDDDCQPVPGWLAALDVGFRQCPDRAIGGPIVNALPANAYSSASQLLVDYLYECHAAASDPTTDRSLTTPPFFTSNNLAVPAALFRDIGGFDESFRLAAGEDREFCDRWQARGHGLLRAPDAVVRHSHELSLSTFWRQHLNYGRGALHLRRARASRGASAIGLEKPSFYWRLVMYPARAPRHQPALVLMLLLFVSQVANALGFALEMRRRS